MKEKYIREIYNYIKSQNMLINPEQPYDEELKSYIVDSVKHNAGKNGFLNMLSEQSYGRRYLVSVLQNGEFIVSPYYVAFLIGELKIIMRRIKFYSRMFKRDIKEWFKKFF